MASLFDLIRIHGERDAGAVALEALNRPPLTYRLLCRQVDATRESLARAGIRRGDCVAVVVPNGPEMAAAFLAIGSVAACAPLNPAYGRDEFDFYVSDLMARAVVVQAGVDSPVREVARRRGIAVIDLVSDAASAAGQFTLAFANGEGVAAGPPAVPNDTALVLHTSGTTSRPKMVPLSHANLCISARNIARTLNLTRRDRCLNVMPLFHIHGLVGAVLSSLAAGAGVVCTPGFQAGGFFDWLHAVRPTWYTAVPTIHQAVLELAPRRRNGLVGRNLRFVRSSSSALPPPVMERMEQLFQVPVIESYGMTEAAHQMCSNPLPPGIRKPGSVGLPAGPEVAIMDEHGNLLPPDATGEIVIRGENVTRGYVGDPAANHACFANGWFRTGDLGRMDRDGYLYIAGRLKEIINRGGEKVSPREIDEVLLEHPALAQAVAFAVPHTRLGEDIAAAVVLRENHALTEQGLRDFAFSRLAPFKVPSQIVFVDQIPKGPTGKLQRIALHEKLAGQLQIPFAEPATETEALVARLFAEVLSRDAVGATDNFFALGGDSLRAAQLIARVRRDCQVELPLAAVFRSPTPRALAAWIDERRNDSAAIALVRMLDEIERLTDEEARQLLRDRMTREP